MSFYYRKLEKKELGYKYQLVKDYTTETYIVPNFSYSDQYLAITKEGTLTVKKYYAWDGATGAIDTKSLMRASLVHDALYQLIRLRVIDPKNRWIADRILCAMYCYDADPIDTGGWPNRLGNWFRRRFISCRCTWVYYAVRVFGTGHARPRRYQ